MDDANLPAAPGKPLRAMLAWLAVIVAVISGLCWNRLVERANAYDFGKGNGSIEERMFIIRKLKDTVGVANCRDVPAVGKKTEFVSLKDETIYVITAPDVKATFCHA